MILAIETSCDETSVAIMNFKGFLLSHITINQKNHKKFGGVVPEIASREHLQILQLIIPRALEKANISLNNIKLFSATCGPGLVGGLLVGSNFARSMAIGCKKTFYPINHLEGHLLSPLINNKKISFPYLALLLTGGHTQTYIVNNINSYELIGESVDDAVGEVFDKVAKILGLSYPGGALIEKRAKLGNSKKYNLPHPLEKDKTLNFSFSGIKTSVNIIIKKSIISENVVNNMSASFQNKIIDILVKKLDKTLNFINQRKINISDVVIVGGVASNKKIRYSLKKFCKKNKLNLLYPLNQFCSDNAAMIAWTCLQHYKNKIKPKLNFKVDPRWQLK
ncbi:MAG: tRNA N6-adenosine threonylcarbamoyltransferase [Alphaproteobacteria bacterium MarineAlpha5_Bin9]|nr:MAG: tRNA N6-adenosine threonylcarbamoyltransferase [Alphaproteobacteria bacterium MarineAlpha5_Bin9]|tara:strand:- start:22787 stop:23794 length:1008 start_codon:yes stop_codon:yes gene_type:complete